MCIMLPEVPNATVVVVAVLLVLLVLLPSIDVLVLYSESKYFSNSSYCLYKTTLNK